MAIDVSNIGMLRSTTGTASVRPAASFFFFFLADVSSARSPIRNPKGKLPESPRKIRAGGQLNIRNPTRARPRRISDEKRITSGTWIPPRQDRHRQRDDQPHEARQSVQAIDQIDEIGAGNEPEEDDRHRQPGEIEMPAKEIGRRRRTSPTHERQNGQGLPDKLASSPHPVFVVPQSQERTTSCCRREQHETGEQPQPSGCRRRCCRIAAIPPRRRPGQAPRKRPGRRCAAWPRKCSLPGLDRENRGSETSGVPA